MMRRKYALLAMTIILSSLVFSSYVRLGHATASPGSRSYLGNCYLSYTPTSPVYQGPPLGLIAPYTIYSAGAGCNGVGYVATGAVATGATFAGPPSSSAIVTKSVTFQDQWFAVPNIGQTNTSM